MRCVREQGVLDNYVACTECGSVRQRLEDFRSLPLQVRGFPTVEASVDGFVKPELMDGSNAVFCEVCSKKTATSKGVYIKKLPKFITLQLQRFEFNYDTMTRTKINDAFDLMHKGESIRSVVTF